MQYRPSFAWWIILLVSGWSIKFSAGRQHLRVVPGSRGSQVFDYSYGDLLDLRISIFFTTKPFHPSHSQLLSTFIGCATRATLGQPLTRAHDIQKLAQPTPTLDAAYQTLALHPTVKITTADILRKLRNGGSGEQGCPKRQVYLQITPR